MEGFGERIRKRFIFQKVQPILTWRVRINLMSKANEETKSQSWTKHGRTRQTTQNVFPIALKNIVLSD